jgi:hypothetical protein
MRFERELRSTDSKARVDVIRIRRDHTEAMLKNGVWTSEFHLLADFLNSLRDDLDTSSPSIPDPDLAFAEYAVARFGGEIIYADPPEPLLEGVSY